MAYFLNIIKNNTFHQKIPLKNHETLRLPIEANTHYQILDENAARSSVNRA